MKGERKELVVLVSFTDCFEDGLRDVHRLVIEIRLLQQRRKGEEKEGVRAKTHPSQHPATTVREASQSDHPKATTTIQRSKKVEKIKEEKARLDLLTTASVTSLVELANKMLRPSSRNSWS